MATQIEVISQRLFGASRKEYLSFREAAEETSLSERSLRRLHEQGKLEVRRVGGRRVIPRESLNSIFLSE